MSCYGLLKLDGFNPNLSLDLTCSADGKFKKQPSGSNKYKTYYCTSLNNFYFTSLTIKSLKCELHCYFIIFLFYLSLWPLQIASNSL